MQVLRDGSPAGLVLLIIPDPTPVPAYGMLRDPQMHSTREERPVYSASWRGRRRRIQMTTYTWIKLYIEILDDPKIGLMPDWLFRRFMQFLLVAREYNHDGLLGPVSKLAWRLRSSEDDMLDALRTMSEIGIVAKTPDGWLVVNFKKRQNCKSYDRVMRYRERYSNGACNGDVTADVSSSSSSSESLSELYPEK